MRLVLWAIFGTYLILACLELGGWANLLWIGASQR